MGGTIGAESEQGRGSTFWFTALLRKTKEESRRIDLSLSPFAGSGVLVIGTDATLRTALREKLKAGVCLSMRLRVPSRPMLS